MLADDEPSAVPKPDSANILSFIVNMQLQLEQNSRLLTCLVADNGTLPPLAKRHRIDVELPMASLNATSPASQNANIAAQTANFCPAQTRTIPVAQTVPLNSNDILATRPSADDAVSLLGGRNLMLPHRRWSMRLSWITLIVL